jgi:hypothetical protein
MKTKTAVWPLSVDLQSQRFIKAWEFWSVGWAQRGAFDACGADDLGWRWHGVFSNEVGAKVSRKKEQLKR